MKALFLTLIVGSLQASVGCQKSFDECIEKGVEPKVCDAAQFACENPTTSHRETEKPREQAHIDTSTRKMR